MMPLAHIKIFTTFALLHSINGVNHRIYRIPHKRLGVVYPNSYNTVISECSNFGRATLSLFLMIIKFFTNATLSKKFSSREQQYLDANGNSTTRSQCNYFSVQGLFFRGVSAVLRTHAAQTHSAQYYSAGQRFQNLLRSGQAKMLLRAGGEFHTGTYRLGAGYALQNRGVEEHFFHFIN